jgi:hypothetical protein
MIAIGVAPSQTYSRYTVPLALLLRDQLARRGVVVAGSSLFDPLTERVDSEV